MQSPNSPIPHGSISKERPFLDWAHPSECALSRAWAHQASLALSQTEAISRWGWPFWKKTDLLNTRDQKCSDSSKHPSPNSCCWFTNFLLREQTSFGLLFLWVVLFFCVSCNLDSITSEGKGIPNSETPKGQCTSVLVYCAYSWSPWVSVGCSSAGC